MTEQWNPKVDIAILFPMNLLSLPLKSILNLFCYDLSPHIGKKVGSLLLNHNVSLHSASKGVILSPSSFFSKPSGLRISWKIEFYSWSPFDEQHTRCHHTHTHAHPHTITLSHTQAQTSTHTQASVRAQTHCAQRKNWCWFTFTLPSNNWKILGSVVYFYSDHCD